MEWMVYVFPIVFILMWMGVLYILSKRGWEDLAKNYAYPEKFYGDRIGLESATINGTNYQNALVLRMNIEGLYMKPVFVMKLWHKPVLIPWKEFKEVRDKRMLFFPYKELIVGHPFVAKIDIKPSLYARMEHYIIPHTSRRHHGR